MSPSRVKRSPPARRKKANEAVPPALETYAKKRDFTVTSEPPPKPIAPKAGPLTFMVHKHDARRLHYDLRLEMQGALASWAIPRGPCYDPKIRRLAVQTEDHPLEYGGFEGRIPDGEYGAGDSIIWDRGVWETVPPGQGPAMRKKGHVEFVLMGEKLKGRWHLVRTRSASGKPEWILFKARDEFASETYDVVEERPESVVSGRRITRGPTPAAVRAGATGDAVAVLLKIWPPAVIAPKGKASARGHVFELRAAGPRAIAGLSLGRVAVQTEEGRDLAAAHPEVVRAVTRLLATEAAVDGAIVEGPRPRFIAHDLLWLDREDVRGRPLEERREMLRAILPPNDDVLALAPWLETAPASLSGLPDGPWAAVTARRRGSTYGDANAWTSINDRRPASAAGRGRGRARPDTSGG